VRRNHEDHEGNEDQEDSFVQKGFVDRRMLRVFVVPAARYFAADDRGAGFIVMCCTRQFCASPV
jgi:hypothetical protein